MCPRQGNLFGTPLIGICAVLSAVYGHGDEGHETMQMSEICDESPERARITVHSAQFEFDNTDFVVRYSLEVDFVGAADELQPMWKRISWGQLVLHHRRRSHIVMIGADMDSFGHVHPDDAITSGFIDEPSDQATVFEAHFGVPIAQKYGLTVSFLADVTNYSNCMATDPSKSMPSQDADTDTTRVRRIEYAPVTTIVVPSNPQWPTGLPRSEGTFLSTDTTTVGRLASLRYSPAMESVATMVSGVGAAQACCADVSINGCTSVAMDAQFMYQHGTGVESVSAADVSDPTLWVPPQIGTDAATASCLVVRFTFTHPRTDAPLGTLADYLGSPMHLVVAASDSLPADSHVASHDLAPNVIAHYHGGVGSLDLGGDAEGECAKVQAYLDQHQSEATPDGSGGDDVTDDNADTMNQIFVAFPTPPSGVYKLFATFNNGDMGGGITLAPFTARIFPSFEQRSSYMNSEGDASTTDVCHNRSHLEVPNKTGDNDGVAEESGTKTSNSHATVVGLAVLAVTLVVMVVASIGYVASKWVSIGSASSPRHANNNNGITVAGLSITPKRQYQQLPICINDSFDGVDVA